MYNSNISCFHDATLSVLLQQTLMFIQAELLPYEFHHQDNDDITMQPSISVLHKWELLLWCYS